VRVVQTRIAHGRGIDQGRDFSEVVGTELVKCAGIRILELSQVLDGIVRSVSISQPDASCQALTMYFSSGVFLDRNCAKERWNCVASLYAGGNRPFKAGGASGLW
jgi:hypothetical protein